MTWIKLDDKTPRHPKIASLTDRAFRWWIKGLCYASEFLTNGVLHPIFWKQVPKQSRAELSGNHLWDWKDPNFEIHDYLEHQQSREQVEAERRRQRDRRKTDRSTPDRRTAGTTPGTTAGQPPEVPRPPNLRVDTDTEKEQSTVPPAPAKPLISGQSNPRDWGRIHGAHTAGFCDWICLPDFVFEEFRSKSPGSEYVHIWAKKVRSEWEGQTIGEDGLRFWRARWSESHRTPEMKKPFSVADALARKAAAK